MYGLVIFFYIIAIIVVIVAFWNIFEKAHEHGWYALIPVFSTYVLSRIANKTQNFRYLLGGIVLSIIFAHFNLVLLCIIGYIFVYIQSFLISYSLAQNFGWKKSASVLFALIPGISYIILGYSSDEYTGKNRTNSELQRPDKPQIDQNVLNDIQNEINNQHIGVNNNVNQFNGYDGNNENMG